MIYITWEDIKEKLQQIPVEFREKKVYGIPRGGCCIAAMLNPVDTPEEADYFIDDLIDSGATKERYQTTYKKPFFALFDKADYNDWLTFPWEREEGTVEDNIIRIIQYIGDNPMREGLLETPKRVVKSYNKLFQGYHEDPAEVLKTTFSEGSCKEMVILKDIEFYSTCEHHMLPFFGKISIGYLPDKKVVGISKLARLVEVFARRLQIQENMTREIADAIMTHLLPKGVIVVCEAQHFCMVARGVEKQNSKMVTSAIRGILEENQAARSEALTLIS